MRYTWQERWVTVRGMRLFSRLATPTEPRATIPIVLIHAYGTSSRYMLPFMRLLAPSYSVATLDLPGHGKSNKAPFVLDFADTAETIAAWMGELALGQALVMGHSSGCQIVLHLGVRFPERLHGAVLLAPALDERTRSVACQGLRLLRIFPYESPRLPFMLLRDYLDARIPHVAQTVEFDLHTEFLGLLPQFTQPTAVVCGSRDPLVPPDWGKRVAGHLPQGRYYEVAGAAHAMHYSKPRCLMTTLTPFLDQVLHTTQP